MRKLLVAAVLAAATFAATTASAASMLFQFNPGASSITVSGNDDRLCSISGGCAATASLLTPFSDLTINEGSSAELDFAKFHITDGWGLDTKVLVNASLAFLTPDAGPASTGGVGSYFHTQGFWIFPSTTGGVLTWTNPVQQFTTPNGSKFTVTFEPIAGFEFGSDAVATVKIAVDSVAAAGGVPEPGVWALLIAGFGMLGFAIRRQRSNLAMTLA